MKEFNTIEMDKDSSAYVTELSQVLKEEIIVYKKLITSANGVEPLLFLAPDHILETINEVKKYRHIQVEEFIRDLRHFMDKNGVLYDPVNSYAEVISALKRIELCGNKNLLRLLITEISSYEKEYNLLFKLQEIDNKLKDLDEMENKWLLQLKQTESWLKNAEQKWKDFLKDQEEKGYFILRKQAIRKLLESRLEQQSKKETKQSAELIFEKLVWDIRYGK